MSPGIRAVESGDLGWISASHGAVYVQHARFEQALWELDQGPA